MRCGMQGPSRQQCQRNGISSVGPMVAACGLILSKVLLYGLVAAP